jgi:hypothetical protein
MGASSSTHLILTVEDYNEFYQTIARRGRNAEPVTGSLIAPYLIRGNLRRLALNRQANLSFLLSSTIALL